MRLLALCCAVLFATHLYAHDPAVPGKKPEISTLKPIKVSEEAWKIHRSATIIDGHNDLPWALREKNDMDLKATDLATNQPKLHTDIPRLRTGGLGAQFWSVYVPAETAYDKAALQTTVEQIDLVYRMVDRYPETFEMAYTVKDIERIRAKGKIASMIGVEGGHSMQESLAVLRTLYQLGARYMTLTHSDNLSWADSATDERKLGGLSKFGEDVVREMNRIGMLVDISHISAETMRHVLKIAKAPVIASHSSAYALAEHPRNIPDDVLKMVKINGGVVMVNFYSGFVVPEGAKVGVESLAVRKQLKKKFPNKADYEAAVKHWFADHPYGRGTIHDVVNHIEHIIKIAGIDHVGLGSDFDGVPLLPEGLDDVSTYPYITQVMLERGYSAKDIKKVLGNNVLRVMRTVEAKSLAAAEEIKKAARL